MKIVGAWDLFLDLNKRYQKICFICWCYVIYVGECNILYFENFKISRDNDHNTLVLPSKILVEPIRQCLEIIFGSLCIFTTRMLDNHIKDGKYADPCEQLYKGIVSLSKTKCIAERNFNMFCKLIRAKPKADMITYEVIIMNRINKTSEWRKIPEKLSPEKRSPVIKWARESVNKQ